MKIDGRNHFCYYLCRYLKDVRMEIKMISVIIPTFNRENTILASVQSVLNQSYKDLELIVVDDCM